MQTTVVIEKVHTRSGTNAKGNWTAYNIKCGDGKVYSTFTAATGTKAQAAEGQQATITYREEQNGEFTNNVVEALSVIGAAPAGQAPAPGAPPAVNTKEKGVCLSYGKDIVCAMIAKGVVIKDAESAGTVATQLADVFMGWMTGTVDLAELGLEKVADSFEIPADGF